MRVPPRTEPGRSTVESIAKMPAPPSRGSVVRTSAHTSWSIKRRITRESEGGGGGGAHVTIYPSFSTDRQTNTHTPTQETNKAEQIRTSSPNEKRLPEILCSRQGIESLARGADVHEGWCIELLEDEIDDVVVQP